MAQYVFIKDALEHANYINIDDELPFPHMPYLYLELVENKDKVARDKRNTFYKPPQINNNNVVIDVSKDIAEINDQEDKLIDIHACVVDQSPQSPAAEIGGSNVSTTRGGAAGNPPSMEEIMRADQVSTPASKLLKIQENEDEMKERNDIYFKYQVLKRMHPKADIPEYSPYADPKMLARKYEVLTKQLTLDSNIESWKRYIIIGVMLCEVGLGKIFKLDMEGFAQEQIVSMNTYESLLAELAEKNYTPQGSKWPVEIRLVGVLMTNLAIFLMSKMILKRTGCNILGNFHETHEKIMNKPPPPPSSTATS